MKKRVLIIGARQSGKTTFACYLDNTQHDLEKKQDIIYRDYSIDVPASYLENSRLYCHILSLAQVASTVVIIVDAEKPTDNLPPNFAKSFNCPVIGLLTKVTHINNLTQAKEILVRAGVSDILIFDKNNSELRLKLLKNFM